MLKNYKSSVRSLTKNLLKGKFYSIFRVLWDVKYREDINYMLNLVTKTEMILSHGQVPLYSIVAGHSINYPKWVESLVNNINQFGWKKQEPIKVVWDPCKLKWLVVDGNHRLEALNRTLPKYIKIPILILRSKNETVKEYKKDLRNQVANQVLTQNIKVSNMTRVQADQIVLGIPYKQGEIKWP